MGSVVGKQEEAGPAPETPKEHSERSFRGSTWQRDKDPKWLMCTEFNPLHHQPLTAPLQEVPCPQNHQDKINLSTEG